MNFLFRSFGGWVGIRLRLRLTTAYSLTSIGAVALLSWMILPVVSLHQSEWTTALRYLTAILAIDFFGQMLYNERILRPVTRFLYQAGMGQVDAEALNEATQNYVSLPRRMAGVSFLFWILSLVAFAIGLYLSLKISPVKLAFLLATGGVAAFIVLIFQFSLFRLLMQPVGRTLVQHIPAGQELPEGFRISARVRLLVTMVLLVMGALTLSGLMGYGQLLRVSGEQAGIQASAVLANLVPDLPADSSAWPDYLRERQRYLNFSLAIWESGPNRVIGALPMSLERIVPALTSVSGEFEDRQTLDRIAFRAVPGGYAIATVPAMVYLSGSLAIVWVTLLILFFAFGTSVAIFDMATRDIIGPFSALRGWVRDLATGSLREPPVIITEDELSLFDGALHEMEGGLRSMFRDMKTSLEHGKRFRAEIGAGMQEIRARSAEQEKSVELAFTSVSGLNGALRDIEENAGVIVRSTGESQSTVSQLENYLDDIRQELVELLDVIRAGNRLIDLMYQNVEGSSNGVNDLYEGVIRLRSSVARVREAFTVLDNEVKSVARSSEHASERAVASNEAVKRIAAGVTVVSTGTENLFAELQNFREGVVRIGGVVDVITEVTEQTALLAFNAAILAAQSGDEHAKDFAVVGDEIKDLAERTESNTKDVGVLMHRIREHTHRSLEEIRVALGRMQQGQLLTGMAVESVESIREQASLNERNARTISEGIFYQNNNIAQILGDVSDELKRLENLRQFTQDSTRDMGELRQGLDQLQRMLQTVQNTTGDQGESTRGLGGSLARMADGIAAIRRDLRTLSAGSTGVVDFMGEIRASTVHNRDLATEIDAQLQRIDALLERVEEKLTRVSVS